MSEKFLILFTYAKSFATPLLGFGSFLTLLEFSDMATKPVLGIIGAIVIAYFSYLGIKATNKTKVEVIDIQTTKTSDIEKANLTLQIFDRAIQEAERARANFSVELQNQREHFGVQLQESRNHYEEKERELRREYHDRLGKVSQLVDKANTNLIKLKLSLSNFGIHVTENYEVILPEEFERRNQ